MDEFYLSLLDSKWSYRGEGNANLVIALSQENLILRFHKSDHKSQISAKAVKEENKKVQRDIHFCHVVMTNFLGRAYVEPPCFTKISFDKVAEIEKKILHLRPVHRRHKGIKSGWVRIFPDYTFLPPNLSTSRRKSRNDSGLLSVENTYCVEIKLKQGWVHPSDRFYPKCTFCMNQYLKLAKKSVSRLSHYCPLDLFSGNEIRMNGAIKNLLDTPQNNLKIFENGEIVYSDEHNSYIDVLRRWLLPNIEEFSHTRLVDKFCTLIREALLKELTAEPLPYKENNVPVKDILNNCDLVLVPNIRPCNWSVQSLPQNCILNRILSMQKLQQCSFSCVYNTFRFLNESDYSYVNRLSSASLKLDIIDRYLLGAVAKDCSVLITFKYTNGITPRSDPTHIIKDNDGDSYLMNIGVVDLDPKPLSCIEKHYKRDKEVLAAFLDINNIRIK